MEGSLGPSERGRDPGFGRKRCMPSLEKLIGTSMDIYHDVHTRIDITMYVHEYIYIYIRTDTYS